MARKATQKPAEDTTATIDGETIAADVQVADAHHQHLATIDATYGDGLPYDPQRLINEARFYLQQSADAMLEAGKRLIVLKEHEQHGEFTHALEQIGIHPRAAQRMMQAAVKFSGSNATLASHLDKSKLLELMIEEDDDLEALANGGTLAGLTLDEIDRMTRDELRKALRTARDDASQERETHEALLANKDNKINELDKALHKLDNAPLDDRIGDLSQRLERKTLHSIGELLALEVVIHETLTWQDAPTHLKNACNQSVNRVLTALDDLRAKYALSDVAHEPEDDAWMEEAREAAASSTGTSLDELDWEEA